VPLLQLPKVGCYGSVSNYMESARHTAVSVVIPTLNAGSDFRQVLQILSIQKPFRHVEIVVVDSGSTDETISIAESYNVKIIRIPPEQFSHSFARNLGAEQCADSDYLLFMTQDAIPPSHNWIYEMYAAAVREGYTAVSCTETMKEDADLYYRFISWNHSQYVGVLNANRAMQLPDNQTYHSLRQNAQLMNNGCFIRKDVFMNYRFRFDYAEDLDLGLRLIKDGHKLGMLGRTHIIHSHNRTAFYYLHRGYINTLSLASLFEDYPTPEPLDRLELARQIAKSYGVLTALVHELYAAIHPYCSIWEMCNETLAFIDRAISGSQASFPIYSHPYADSKFFAYISSNHVSGKDAKREDLLYSLKDFVHLLCEYFRSSYESMNPYLFEEVKYCLFKLLAELIGRLLAASYLKSPEHRRHEIMRLVMPISRGVEV